MLKIQGCTALVILTLHLRCWNWDTQHPAIVLQEQSCSCSASKSSEVLQWFTWRQNATVRNFPCGFKLCYLAWRQGVSVMRCLVWEGIEANVQYVLTQRIILCVLVTKLQYHEFSLNLQVMMLLKGVIGSSSPSLTAYFQLLCSIGMAFVTLWLLEPSCWSNWKLIISQKENKLVHIWIRRLDGLVDTSTGGRRGGNILLV